MPTVALSMIVKNGGEELRACLASARPFVDQIVIADTGSTDSSVEIAKSFGATVISVRWNDDFAEARNAALEPVTTDWVLSLDADEEMTPQAGRKLKALLAHVEDKTGGHLFPVRNYFAGAVSGINGSIGRINTDRTGRLKQAQSYGVHHCCKLFRRHPEIRFTGRIHEGVGASLLSAGFAFANADLPILHFGNLATETQVAEKQAYYRHLLRMAVQETPELPHLWVQLAIEELKYFNDPETALVCAAKAVELLPNAYEAWSVIALVHGKQGRPEQALEALRHLPDAGDRGLTKLCAMADATHDLGRLREAEGMYLQALRRLRQREAAFPEERVASVESRLGYTEVRQGSVEAGLRRLHRAIERCPLEVESHERLIKAYLMQGNERGAADAAEASLRSVPVEKLFRRAVALRVHLNEVERAAMLAEAGIVLYPGSESLQAMRAELQERLTAGSLAAAS